MTVVLGWAEKKGGIIKNWKRRHFVITNTRLEYSETENGKPLGAIDLGDVTKIASVGATVTLTTPRRIWEIRGVEGDLGHWRKSICDASPKLAGRVATVRPTASGPLSPPRAAGSGSVDGGDAAPPDPAPAAPAVAAPPAGGDGREFGLLLCGSGESGKTTFYRQLRLRLAPAGISEVERRGFAPTIRGNVIEAMQMLLVWAEQNSTEIDADLVDQASLISSVNPFNCEPSTEIGDALDSLWADSAIAEAFSHRDEMVIPDHMDYFFKQVLTVMDSDYLPSTDDILRARIRTIGIEQLSISIDGTAIRFVDIGGQKNERAKLDQVKGDIAGLAYVVSLADFDKPLFEALPLIQPRMDDAIAFFRSILQVPEFSELPVFLLCNKFDGFTAKIQSTDRFARAFSDFPGNMHDPQECLEFLVGKFKEVTGPGRRLEVLSLVAIDSDQVVDNANRMVRYIRQNCLGA
jgi:GTPase SAR1 family protein